MEQIERPKMNKEVKALIEEAIAKSPGYNRHQICETLGELLQSRYYDNHKKFHTKEMGTTSDLLEKIDMVMIDLMQKRLNEEKKETHE